MFRPNWPSSDVAVVLVKVLAAHCNVVLFSPILDASGYFGYVGYQSFILMSLGCMWLLLILYGLLVLSRPSKNI
jgi:hypothetical protein